MLTARENGSSKAPAAADHDVVRLVGVTKVYGRDDASVTALHEVSLGFGDGSFTAVMGPSGSGKSALLHRAAGLDRPDVGSVDRRPRQRVAPHPCRDAHRRHGRAGRLPHLSR